MKQEQQKNQDMIIHTVELPQDINDLLERFAKKLHKSKSDFIIQAILNYLEDQEDIEIAEAALAKKSKTYSHEEVKSILEL